MRQCACSSSRGGHRQCGLRRATPHWHYVPPAKTAAIALSAMAGSIACALNHRFQAVSPGSGVQAVGELSPFGARQRVMAAAAAQASSSSTQPASRVVLIGVTGGTGRWVLVLESCCRAASPARPNSRQCFIGAVRSPPPPPSPPCRSALQGLLSSLPASTQLVALTRDPQAPPAQSLLAQARG